MQRFNFPKTPEDARVARRTGLIVATVYFVAALGLMLVSQLAGTSLFPILPLYVADLMHTTHVATATGWLFAASGLAGARRRGHAAGPLCRLARRRG